MRLTISLAALASAAILFPPGAPAHAKTVQGKRHHHDDDDDDDDVRPAARTRQARPAVKARDADDDDAPARPPTAGPPAPKAPTAEVGSAPPVAAPAPTPPPRKDADDDDVQPATRPAGTLPPKARDADDDDDDVRPSGASAEIVVTARRLDTARASVEPSLGAATDSISNDTFENRPLGETTSIA